MRRFADIRPRASAMQRFPSLQTLRAELTLCARRRHSRHSPILVKRPVHIGARRLEYRVTGKGEALRPALELIEGWGNGASVALQDDAAQVRLEPI